MPVEEVGDAAEAGTVAHHLANEWLVGGGTEPLFLLESEVYDGIPVALGPARRQKIAKATSFYAETVLAYPGERRTEIKIPHKKIANFGGTVDTLLVDTHEDGAVELHIADLKTGLWKVKGDNNPQLLSYLILARQEVPEASIFRTTVIQPLVPNSVESYTYTSDELDLFEERVDKATKSANIVSGEHCRFCPFLKAGLCTPGKMYASKAGWKQGA